MVKPGSPKPPCPIPGRGGFARGVRFVGVCVLALASGCGVVSKTRLDECHRVTQTLRAENDKLRDVALDLRSRNQDLSQRAVDDAERLATQQDAIARLERSVMGYQAEREKMAATFESLMRQVRTAVNTVPDRASHTPENLGLGAFALAHPGWELDPARMALSIPIDRVFEPGGSGLTGEAESALRSLGTTLSSASSGDTEGSRSVLLVSADAIALSPVRRAGFDGDETQGSPLSDASTHFLAAARAAKIRETLVGAGNLDPARVRVAAPADDVTTANAGHAVPRLEIRLLPANPAEPRGPLAAGAAPAAAPALDVGARRVR